MVYNYLCNQCLSRLTLWVRIPLRRGVLDTTLCYKVCQWLAAGRWFSLGIPVSSTNKTDHHDITEILLKVALNTITLTHNVTMFYLYPPTYNSISATSISWWSDLLVAESTDPFQITDRFNLVRLYRVHLAMDGNVAHN
jgi:hypothetical protein